jgi:WD40 repeat protein
MENKPFRSLWRRSWGWLLLFAILVIATPFLAFAYFPCSGLDIIRKANGCVKNIPYSDSILHIAFSKDGKTFATSDFRSSVDIWSYPDTILLNHIQSKYFDIRVSLSSDGEMLAMGGYQGPILIVESKTGKILHTLIEKSEDNYDVTFTPDDQFVISISKAGLQTWDVATGNLVNSLSRGDLQLLEMSRDGTLLALGRRDGAIDLWSMAEHRILTTFQQPNVRSMAFSPDGQHLFATRVDVETYANQPDTFTSFINIWDIKNGEIERTITLQNAGAHNIAISRNGDMFIVGDNKCPRESENLLFEKTCAYLGQTTGDKNLIGLKIPRSVMMTLEFSPTDDKILIGSLYIWQKP